MNRSTLASLVAALLAIGATSCSRTDMGTNPGPAPITGHGATFLAASVDAPLSIPTLLIPSTPQVAYPKTGSTFAFLCQPDNGASYGRTDSVELAADHPDSFLVKLYVALSPRSDTGPSGPGFSLDGSGDCWFPLPNESASKHWMARLGTATLGSYPCEIGGESGFTHSFGRGMGTQWTISRDASTKYLGDESFVVGAETLAARHFLVSQSYHNHFIDYDNNVDTVYTGVVNREYWYAPSIGYFVKVVEPYRGATVTRMLTAYRLVR
ncbi:MAG: hypothetical protein JST22_03875 [Bacteroidetes bacterium]|nr:hypothetical protein [Bacteroidota bacterium]